MINGKINNELKKIASSEKKHLVEKMEEKLTMG